MGPHLNPMVLLEGFRCEQLKFCTLHVANLGFVQTHNASILLVLLGYGPWAGSNTC